MVLKKKQTDAGIAMRLISVGIGSLVSVFVGFIQTVYAMNQ
jgi:hypothetical protein